VIIAALAQSIEANYSSIMRLICAFFAVLAVSGAAAAPAAHVRDASTAITLAQKYCPQKSVVDKGGWDALLAQNSSPKAVDDTGHWSAKLVGNSWHVWFGNSQKEPECDFRGAYVPADGTNIDCVLTAC
jgi:hypothetical protein